ncbi:MAG: excinuclease ABC subunit UvrC, partial [Burkholderiales bacterium]|nr:excinuclease ABC subunit UvrC [Burkholderiales bacterium]
MEEQKDKEQKDIKLVVAEDDKPAKKFEPKEFLKTLPNLPGVYRYFDSSGRLLYVGKARDLKRRVSSYFQKTLPPRTRMMVDMIANAEITVVNSEAQALILEANLIKTQNPLFNIVFRDDASYPYLKFSAGKYPRLSYFRGNFDKASTFFGPFPNANAAKETLGLVQKVFKIRTCENSVFNNRSRPCLLYQIQRCCGACCGLVTPEEYKETVDLVKTFLKGRSDVIQEGLTRKMEAYAKALEFEKAAVVRDMLTSVSSVVQQQIMEATPDANADIIAVAIEGGEVCVNLAMVRGGRHLGDRAVFPKIGKDTDIPTEEEVLEAFISQHYQTMDVPPVVIAKVEDKVTEIEDLLNNLTTQKTSLVRRPQNVRRKWLELAEFNAKLALNRRLSEEGHQIARIEALVKALGIQMEEEDFGNFTVECFDISHSSGEATQASCVVFSGNKMDSSKYRRFNINDVAPGDDYAAMKQVLTRRYTRVVKGEMQMPTVVLVDGGKGQVHMACEVFDELGLDKKVIVGVKKGEGRKVGLEELVFADPDKPPLKLGKESAALMLIAQIRDEAHRFAITGMRAKRAKARNYSKIEDLE